MKAVPPVTWVMKAVPPVTWRVAGLPRRSVDPVFSSRRQAVKYRDAHGDGLLQWKHTGERAWRLEPCTMDARAVEEWLHDDYEWIPF